MTVTVRDVDKLLDVLGSAVPTNFDTGDGLVGRLLHWRQGCDPDPVPELVDTETALAAIAYGIRRRRAAKLRRTLAAVALIVVVLAVLGLVLAPLTPWWWLVPVLGITGLAAVYVFVATMPADTEWTTKGVTGQDGAAS